MSKFLRSLSDGSLRCRYCGDEECRCMEDGWTTVEFITIWRYGDKGTSILMQFKRQKLPNGKLIPSGYRIWIPKKQSKKLDLILKKVTLNNDFLNKLRFS